MRLLARLQLLEDVDVRAGDERRAGADQDDGVRGRIVAGALDGVADRLRERRRSGRSPVGCRSVTTATRSRTSYRTSGDMARKGIMPALDERGSDVDFEYSAKVKDLQARLTAFMDEHVYPNEATFRSSRSPTAIAGSRSPIVEELKAKARAAGCGICSCRRASTAPG